MASKASALAILGPDSTAKKASALDILGLPADKVPTPEDIGSSMSQTFRDPRVTNAIPYAAAAGLSTVAPEAGLPWLARLGLGSALAGLGGAAAEPIRYAAGRAVGTQQPETPQELQQGMLAQGEKQAGLEAGGRVLAGGIGLLGKGIYRVGMNKAGAILAQFPGALDKLLELGAPAGRWAALPWEKVAGSKIATNAWARSAENTAQLVAQAKQAGNVVDISHLAQPLIAAATKAEPKMAQPAMQTAYIKSIEDRANEIIGMRTQGVVNPGLKQLEPQDVLDLRHYGDQLSSQAQRARQFGIAPPISQVQTSGLANAARNYLHTLPGGLGDKLIASDANTRALIGAKQAMGVVENQPGATGGYYLPMSAGMAARSAAPGLGPIAGAAGYLAEKSVMSPELLTRLGLLMRSPAAQDVLQNLPRAAGALAGQ